MRSRPLPTLVTTPITTIGESRGYHFFQRKAYPGFPDIQQEGRSCCAPNDKRETTTQDNSTNWTLRRPPLTTGVIRWAASAPAPRQPARRVQRKNERYYRRGERSRTLLVNDTTVYRTPRAVPTSSTHTWKPLLLRYSVSERRTPGRVVTRACAGRTDSIKKMVPFRQVGKHLSFPEGFPTLSRTSHEGLPLAFRPQSMPILVVGRGFRVWFRALRETLKDNGSILRM